MEEEIERYKHVINKKRNEIISSLAAISIFLTTASGIVIKDRLKSTEKIYNTEKYTYNDYYNTVSHNYEYLSEVDNSILLIRKVTPWVVYRTQAKRMIKIYRINNISFDDLIYKGNYKRVIDNISYEEINEYKYKNELRDYDRYEDSFFEVIEYNQNKDDYITKRVPVGMDTILMLLTEMLIYLFVLKVNGGPLYENILLDINDINKCKDKIRKLKK